MEKKKETSSRLAGRIVKISIFLQAGAIIFIYFFSKSILYSIISLLGAIIGVLGFLLMMKMIDRTLKRGKGQALFFLVLFSKMAVISGVFFLVSRESRTAVLVYILGLSTIVAAVLTEAGLQFGRSIFHGRT